MTVCTCRTVEGPRSHRIRRIASSASVGLGILFFFMGESIYDVLRSVNENLRSAGRVVMRSGELSGRGQLDNSLADTFRERCVVAFSAGSFVRLNRCSKAHFE